jgi:hypothetical protein
MGLLVFLEVVLPLLRFFLSIAILPNPLIDGTSLCATDAGLEIYQVIKRSACDGVDLTANPALDRTSAPCDAISNAITFTAVTATVGTVYEPPNGESACPGFVDSCDK